MQREDGAGHITSVDVHGRSGEQAHNVHGHKALTYRRLITRLKGEHHMQMRCMGRTVAAIVLSCVPFIASADDTGVKGAPFSSLYVFSGSLSDTGNAASVSGDFPAPLYKNRTTNGPAAIDILASAFHLTADP